MKKLTGMEKAAYAAPAFALAVVGIPIYVYIPKFYTDVMGVHATVLGAILLLVRFFDAFTDPAVGLLSDRMRTPMGRRRPLIAIGAISTAIAMSLLFNPPAGMMPGAAGYWFMAMMFSLFLSWTLVIVPYESLGPELTFDYNERTALFSIRDGALIAGTVVAAAMPGMVRWFGGLGMGAADEQRIFFILSIIYAPLIVMACAWCVAAFRERPEPGGDRTRIDVFKRIRSGFANRPFRILLIAYTISAIGSNLPATLILYYVEHVIGSTRADLFLALYFVTGIAFLPLWVRLARSAGKKTAWLSAMALNTGAFFWVFFLGYGDEHLYAFLVFLSGIGFGATLAIPSAIQADVIDYDELRSGERREGLYVGLWSISKKLAAAAGVGIGLSLLGAAGYRPGTDQPESVILMLRLLYAAVPCVCNAVAIVIAARYPINGEIHKQIRYAVDERAKGKSVADPLVPGHIIDNRTV